ncbi:hypothetical protein CEXT_715841 [Caerostris extrusa]|uniref:LAGLIDADG homing endonuclease n=1 Tax=Caerostris extrusa TaxID=172846 RepID=A0AAV4WIE0_CAEEX|nr:hypothetical protein CEXT_715841 [Caerostris extrusa]
MGKYNFACGQRNYDALQSGRKTIWVGHLSKSTTLPLVFEFPLFLTVKDVTNSIRAECVSAYNLLMLTPRPRVTPSVANCFRYNAPSLNVVREIATLFPIKHGNANAEIGMLKWLSVAGEDVPVDTSSFGFSKSKCVPK